MVVGILPHKPAGHLSETLSRKGRLVDWTKGNNLRLLQNCIERDNLNYRDTAERLGVSFTCIYNAARKYDVRSKHRCGNVPKRVLSNRERQLFIDLHSIGHSVVNCAELMGIPKTTLQTMVTRDGKLLARSRDKRKRETEKILGHYK